MGEPRALPAERPPRRPLASLRARRNFVHAYEEGSRISDRDFVLHAVAGESGGFRLGITTSRRLGSAVVRNRARRRVREALRTLEPPPAGDWDVVVVVRRTLLATGFAELQRRLEAALRRAGIQGPKNG